MKRKLYDKIWLITDYPKNVEACYDIYYTGTWTQILKAQWFFKVILVTGARQVGKTTMLKHLAESDITYVTMDNAMARELAHSDPVLFFQTYKPPILIAEVQKAPELFE